MKMNFQDILFEMGIYWYVRQEVGRTAIYHGEIQNCCYQNALHRSEELNQISTLNILWNI